MKPVAANLYRSDPEDPFGRGDLLTHAFLIQRPTGNALIYSSGQLEKEEAKIHAMGGLTHQYLNHRDEAAAHCDWVSKTFGSKLVCHEAEKDAVSARCAVHQTISGATELSPDLIAMPTPGHCPGSTCYLWDGPDGRFLFPGDTIYLDDGVWKVFIDPENARDMIESLHIIGALDFDVMLPGLYQGDIWRADVTKDVVVDRIGAILERLEAGQTH